MAYVYNLHDILSIKSDFSLSRKNKFSPTFDCFGCDNELPKYDLVIDFAESSKKKLDDYREIAYGLYYSLSEESIISNLTVLGINVFWEIKGLSKDTTKLSVSRAYKTLSRYLTIPISSMNPLFLLVRNILQMKLLLKNSMFLIGSAVYLNNRGIMFTGTTGSGKTTTMLSCMDILDANFVTNDIMILSNNNIFGFLSHILERPFNFSLLSYHKFIDPSQKYNNRTSDKFSSNCDIYFLEKSASKQIKELSLKEGVNKLLTINNKMHPYFSERTLSAFSYINPDFSLFNMQKKSQSLLLNQFKDAKFYILLSSSAESNAKLIKEKYK